jgi:hypothetical protein
MCLKAEMRKPAVPQAGSYVAQSVMWPYWFFPDDFSVPLNFYAT